MDSDTVKHLEFIQSVVTRMNANSFQLKGWAIAVYSALLVLFASSDGNELYLYMTVVPILLFWFLDTYYLQQERKFRGIYNDVANLSSESTKINVRLFEMPIHKYNGGKYSYWNVMWSRTVWPLYVTMIGIAVLCVILSSLKSCGVNLCR